MVGKLEYKREQDGAVWLTIDTGWLPGSDWTLTIAGHPGVAVVGGARQLAKSPFEVQSPDGSGILRVEVPDIEMWRSPNVFLNGSLLPGSAGSPEGQMQLALAWPSAFVALAFVGGLVNTYSSYQYGLFSPLSWNLVTIASLVGVVLMWKNRPEGMVVFIVALGLDTLVGVVWVSLLDWQRAGDAWFIWLVAAVDMGVRVNMIRACFQWKRSGTELGLFR